MNQKPTTDETIFTSRSGEWMPPLRDYLGELTNELDDEDHITTFVSGGPKKLCLPDKKWKDDLQSTWLYPKLPWISKTELFNYVRTSLSA